jgi:hypothetical protein
MWIDNRLIDNATPMKSRPCSSKLNIKIAFHDCPPSLALRRKGLLAEQQGEDMAWRTLGVLAAAVFAATVTVTPAVAAETPQWQLTLLPLPADSPNAKSTVEGADGHGGYAGEITTAAGYAIVTWHCGKVVVHPGPNGENYPWVRGESWDGTLLLSGMSTGPSTLDPAGVFHTVSVGPWRYAGPSVIGPRGDLVGQGDDPVDLSPVSLHWPSPGAEPVVLAGALPQSYPVAIDYDGTVLFGNPDGPYLLHDGVVRKLALPAGYHDVRATAIRRGIVTGVAFPTDGPGDQGLVWQSPDSPQVLPNSLYMTAANTHGLSVGEGRDGADAAWQDGQELGRLPGMAGLPAVHGRFVDEDGTIAGDVSANSAVPGRSARWRLTAPSVSG